MEKLSDKNPCNTCTVDRQVGNPYSWQSECDRCMKPSRWKDECVKKLKEYEDLGQRCIEETNFGLEMLPDKWMEFYDDIEQFYKWQELEEQGRLLELPCAVGDTVYDIVPADMLNPNRCEFKIRECRNVNLTYITNRIKYFGETVFLTREEADKVLKSMKGDGRKK